MFARLLCCALCACCAAPCLGETVTYDFTTATELPDWIASTTGVITPGYGLMTRGDGLDDTLIINLNAGSPIRVTSFSVSTSGDELIPRFSEVLCPNDSGIPILFPNNEPAWTPFMVECDCYTSFNATNLVVSGGFKYDYDVIGIWPAALNSITFETRLAGDSDDDGDIDLNDFNNVRNHFGERMQFDAISPGDVVRDGAVDLADLNAVRNNFGSSTPVPEPSSLALALLVLIIAPRILRRAHPRSPRDSQ